MPATQQHPTRISLWLLVVLLIIMGLETGIALLLGWRPEGIIAHTGFILFITLALLTIASFKFPRLQQAWGRGDRERTLLIISGIIAILLLDFGAGVLLQRHTTHAFFHTRGANIKKVFHPDPDYLPTMHDPIHFTTNARGIRAPRAPKPGEEQWLTIGGSTTECMYLDDTKTWQARLMTRQQNPGVWIGNVGISGFDTHEHIQFMDSSPLLDTVDGVILQIGINDYWRFIAGEEEKIKYKRFQEASTPEVVPIQSDVVQKNGYVPYWTSPNMLQLYRVLRRERNQASQAPPKETHEGIGGEEYHIRRQKRVAATHTPNLPDLTTGLQCYSVRIESLIAHAKRRNLKIIFTTQPVLWKKDLDPSLEERCWFGWLNDDRYLSIEALRQGMDAYNQCLLSLCQQHKIPCVNLDSLNGTDAYFYDDCHFTEEGAQAVAQAIHPILDTRLSN